MHTLVKNQAMISLIFDKSNSLTPNFVLNFSTTLKWLC